MFKFTVKPDDGDPYTATATSRDVVSWEKTTKNRSLADLSEPKMADLYGLAHVAVRRLGLFDGDRQEFERSVDLEFQADEEPDPTRRVR